MITNKLYTDYFNLIRTEMRNFQSIASDLLEKYRRIGEDEPDYIYLQNEAFEFVLNCIAEDAYQSTQNKNYEKDSKNISIFNVFVNGNKRLTVLHTSDGSTSVQVSNFEDIVCVDQKN